MVPETGIPTATELFILQQTAHARAVGTDSYVCITMLARHVVPG